MKRWLILLLALALCCTAAAEIDFPATAEQYMTLFANGEYDSLFAVMTPEMQSALSAEALQQTVAALGAIETFLPPTMTEQQGYQIADFSTAQGGAGYVYRIVLDAEGKIAGLNILPGSLPAPSTDVPDDLCAETVLLRPGAADETEATLLLPAGEGPFPAVILVHGSGPNDRDESVYGMTPLKDIAEGLARNGIASIRYDKYTYAHADKIADPAAFTVQQEYIDDAAAALAALENDERISDIYLAGHSQGGMLMPRIITELGADRFAGGIAIAGTPLHMWEVQYAQNMMILEQLSGDDKTAAEAIIAAEMAKLDQIPNWTDEERQQNTFFGVSAYYQWDDMSHDAADLANALDLPLLMLQGDADWQVPVEIGTDAWAAACPNAQCVRLNGLTHMLNAVENPSGTTADYVSGAKVDDRVIETIAEFILPQ